MKDEKFAEKFGLVGQGQAVKISEDTKELVKSLAKLSEAKFETDQALAKIDKTKYK
jgi:hypothetical protein